MERFCNACQLENPPMRCGKCKVVYYCNTVCQIINWPVHRKLCCQEGTPEERQAKAIQEGGLHFKYLNPRLDRCVQVDAGDTSNAIKVTPGCKQLLEHMHLDPKSCQMMYIDRNILLPYGHCCQNVRSITRKHGGRALFGWCLYEGKLVAEAEFHAVWVHPSDGTFVNVTANSQNRPYCGMFVPDPAVESVLQAPSNVIFWK